MRKFLLLITAGIGVLAGVTAWMPNPSTAQVREPITYTGPVVYLEQNGLQAFVGVQGDTATTRATFNGRLITIDTMPFASPEPCDSYKVTQALKPGDKVCTLIAEAALLEKTALPDGAVSYQGLYFTPQNKVVVHFASQPGDTMESMAREATALMNDLVQIGLTDYTYNELLGS